MGIKINIVCSMLSIHYPLVNVPLKCTGSLMLQLRDVHLYHIKSYQTNTWGFVEKNTRAVVP